jgi:hypothetical protein
MRRDIMRRAGTDHVDGDNARRDKTLSGSRFDRQDHHAAGHHAAAGTDHVDGDNARRDKTLSGSR